MEAVSYRCLAVGVEAYAILSRFPSVESLPTSNVAPPSVTLLLRLSIPFANPLWTFDLLLFRLANPECIATRLFYRVNSSMKLENFPLEVLTQIIHGDHSYLAIELWKCGSVVLNGKLRRSITSIDLTHKSACTTTRYPRCLKEFINLRRLSIFSLYHGLCSAPTLSNELRQLPSTLTDLEFRVKDASPLFFGHVNVRNEDDQLLGDDELPPPSKRSKLEETPNTENEPPFLRHVSQLWPNLRRLTVGGGGPPLAAVNFIDFSMLPRTLEYLDLSMAYFAENHLLDNSEGIPSGLKTLMFSEGFLSTSDLHFLPPSLTNIGSSLSIEAMLTLAENPTMLPNLETFPVWESERAEAMEEFNNEILSNIRKWPSNIKELVFMSETHSTIFNPELKLPAQLEILDTWDQELTAPQLELIPRSVTSLDVGMVDWTKVTLSMWPPCLKTLMLRQFSNGSQYLHLLPRTLTKLTMDIAGDAEVPVESYSSASGLEALNGADKELWNTIKSTLRDSGFNGGDASAYISAVESGRLFGLPLTLTDLNISSRKEHPTLPLLLPPQLHKFTFSVPRWFDALEYFHLLPPSLTEIGLTDHINSNPFQSCIAKWDSEMIDPTTTWLFRSKNLTSLKLSCSPSIMAPVLKYLPRTLLHLVFQDRGYSRFHEWVLAGQPAQWAQDLPSSLTSLTTRLNAPDLATMPSTLLYLQARIAGPVTLDDVLRLPKHLLRVSLRASSPNSETDEDEDASAVSLNDSQLASFSYDYQPFRQIFEYSRQAVEAQLEVRKGGRPAPIESWTIPTSDIDERTILRLQRP